MVEVTVHKLVTDPATNQPIVLLQTLKGDMALPLVIGGTEAMSIYAGLTQEPSPRPLTHDLTRTILDHFEAMVHEVHIVDLKDDVFFAELVLASEGGEIRLDSRPSDAIALALKYGAPIFLAEEILTQAGYNVKQKAGASKSVRELPERAGPTELTEEAVDEAIDALLEEAEAPEKEKEPEGRLVALKQQMAEAVKMEQYEAAGQLKREIEKLERS
jgi:hypothetical protein